MGDGEGGICTTEGKVKSFCSSRESEAPEYRNRERQGRRSRKSPSQESSLS